MPTHFEASLRHASYYEDLLRTIDSLYLEGSEALERGSELFAFEWSNIRAGHD